MSIEIGRVERNSIQVSAFPPASTQPLESTSLARGWEANDSIRPIPRFVGVFRANLNISESDSIFLQQTRAPGSGRQTTREHDSRAEARRKQGEKNTAFGRIWMPLGRRAQQPAGIDSRDRISRGFETEIARRTFFDTENFLLSNLCLVTEGRRAGGEGRGKGGEEQEMKLELERNERERRATEEQRGFEKMYHQNRKIEQCKVVIKDVQTKSRGNNRVRY